MLSRRSASGDAYGFALFANKPIVLLESFKENFAHGGAVFEVDGVVYILVQLNPYSLSGRRQEAKVVAQLASKYSTAGRAVVVMGDFNNPSPHDAKAGWHDQFDCSSPTKCPSGACNWVCEDGHINYDSVSTILQNGLFKDLHCLGENCTCQAKLPDTLCAGAVYLSRSATERCLLTPHPLGDLAFPAFFPILHRLFFPSGIACAAARVRKGLVWAYWIFQVQWACFRAAGTYGCGCEHAAPHPHPHVGVGASTPRRSTLGLCALHWGCPPGLGCLGS